MSLSSAYTSIKRALSTAPPPDAYLPWDTPGVENPPPNEEEIAHQIGQTMNSMQQHNLSQHGHAYRATHVKTQGIVKGTLTVLPNLPSHLQQGLFKTPGKSYDVAARYANEPVWLAPDQDPGPRGLAIRVFGVEGEREGDPDATTQDFFFNNAPSIELTDAATCLDVMRMRERYFDSPVKLGAAARLRTDALKQVAPFQLPSKDLLGMSFYSQSAFRFGEWYGHLGVFPIGEEMGRREKGVGSGDGRDALSRWLREYFQGKGAKYEIRIQLGTSPEHHPTEDGSIVWDEATAPYQTIATVEFPPQDSLAPERRVFWEDRMRLNPWECLAEHRPLGGINRVRRTVYTMSRQKRERENATKTLAVTSIDEIP